MRHSAYNVMVKHCWACKITKDVSEFYKNAGRYDGLGSLCKSCASTRQKVHRQRPDVRARLQAEAQSRNTRNGTFQSTKSRRLKYGVTEAMYKEMLIKQGGVCDICRKPDIRGSLAVDHCHQTQIVRGLLCSNCNVGLGHLRDDVNLLTAAIHYLGRFKTNLVYEGG